MREDEDHVCGLQPEAVGRGTNDVTFGTGDSTLKLGDVPKSVDPKADHGERFQGVQEHITISSFVLRTRMQVS